MSNSRFVFFGTDELAVTVLNTLKEQSLVPSLIVTTPDTPQGRKLVLTPPAVKTWAEENSIPVIQPKRLTPIPTELAGGTYDFYLVASYGKIIPAALLSLPPHGTLNIHPSLLPDYRGPAPLQTAILNGDEKTGVTIIKIDEEVDHGPLIAQETFPLSGTETYESLRDTLATQGAKLFASILPDWLAGTLTATPQDHSKATFTEKITKADGLIKLEDSPVENDRKIRAYSPWPHAYFFITKNDRPYRIVIKKAHLEDGELILDRVIPEGKHEMAWADFARNL